MELPPDPQPTRLSQELWDRLWKEHILGPIIDRAAQEAKEQADAEKERRLLGLQGRTSPVVTLNDTRDYIEDRIAFWRRQLENGTGGGFTRQTILAIIFELETVLAFLPIRP